MDDERTAEEPEREAGAPEPAETGSTATREPTAPERPAPTRPDEARGRAARLSETREPVYREVGGYRLRLEPSDLAKLRELPGSKEKSDQELGESFFDGQAARLAAAIADDVPAPAELRVVVDPYSRQAFLALGNTIRGIVSF